MGPHAYEPTLADLDQRLAAARRALADALRDPDSDSERFTLEAMVCHWERERDAYLRRFYARRPHGNPYLVTGR